LRRVFLWPEKGGKNGKSSQPQQLDHREKI
jgi:hypothetical protein